MVINKKIVYFFIFFLITMDTTTLAMRTTSGKKEIPSLRFQTAHIAAERYLNKQINDENLEKQLNPEMYEYARFLISNNNNLTKALLEAVVFHSNYVEDLLKAGADPNYTDFMGNNTPLMWAARFGRLEIAKILMKYGANINLKNGSNVTAFIIASIYNQPAIVNELIHYSSEQKEHKLTKKQIKLALKYGAQAGSTPALAEIIKNFKETGIEKDTFRSFLQTALFEAIRYRNNATVDLILKLGKEFELDINALNTFNETPLMIASSIGHKPTVETILNYGPDINFKNNNGRTALMNATSAGKNEISDLLIKNGASS
jgi:ankyrin repeat protein